MSQRPQIQASNELTQTLKVILSIISKCEKIQPKFSEGTSQHSLLNNRLKAMYISKALLTNDCEIEQYSKDDLMGALKPVESIISKCITGQRKHDITSLQYRRFQSIIDAMNVAKLFIENEISKKDKL